MLAGSNMFVSISKTLGRYLWEKAFGDRRRREKHNVK
jgi:hypothetical protein